MDEAKIKEIVSGAVSEAFENQQAQPVECSLGLNREKHTKEHDFIEKLIGLSDRLDKIKWGFFGTMVKGAGLFTLGLLCLGVITWLKVEVTK